MQGDAAAHASAPVPGCHGEACCDVRGCCVLLQGAKATDALLNYETVKLFNNEALERHNFAAVRPTGLHCMRRAQAGVTGREGALVGVHGCACLCVCHVQSVGPRAFPWCGREPQECTPVPLPRRPSTPTKWRITSCRELYRHRTATVLLC